MYSHKAIQILRTLGRSHGIINLQASYICSDGFFVVYSDVFLYVIESHPLASKTSNRPSSNSSSIKVSSSSSPSSTIKKTWRFRSRILKVLECKDLGCLFILTKDGNIWRLEFAEIFEDITKRESKVSVDDENDGADIFGALLVEPTTSKGESISNERKPTASYKLRDESKVLQDNEIVDMFSIGEELIIMKQNGQKQSIQKLIFDEEGVSSYALFEVFYKQGECSGLQNDACSRYGSATESCTKSTKKKCGSLHLLLKDCASINSSALRIKQNLFSTAFSLSNTLRYSFILLFGDMNGKTCYFPLDIHQKSNDGLCIEGRAYKFPDKKHFVCDLQQPLLDVFQLDVKDICVKKPWSLYASKERNQISESQLSVIKEQLRDETALVMVCKSGKAMIIMQLDKKYNKTSFNADVITGPVLSASAVKDLLVYASGDEINLSKISIDVTMKDGLNLSLKPSFKPVYMIKMIGAASISQKIFTSNGINGLIICFLAANVKGCVYDITVNEVPETDSPNVSEYEESERIQYLLQGLETAHNSIKKWHNSSKCKNTVLQKLQVLSSIMTDLMFAHEITTQGKSSDNNSGIHCMVRDLSLEADQMLHLHLELCNNSHYDLTEQWTLLCIMFARELPHNAYFGGSKAVSKSFKIHALISKSKATYRWSIDISKLEIVFPMKMEFKLVFKLPETEAATDTCNNGNSSHIFLPLNIHHITILDVSHVDRELQILPNIIRNVHIAKDAEMSCIHKKFCFPSNTAGQCFGRPNVNFPLLRKDLLLPSFIARFLSSKSEGSSTNQPTVENMQQIFLSCLFPDKVFKEWGNNRPASITIQLPCKHNVKICFTTTDEKHINTHDISITVEEHCIGLLIQTHAAILSRLESLLTQDSSGSFQMNTNQAIHEIKALQNDLFPEKGSKNDWLHISQKLQKMMDVFFKCRSLNVL